MGFKPIEEKPITTLPIKTRWHNKHPEHAEWTNHLIKLITEKSSLLLMTPKDIANFTKNYEGNELQFWVHLFSCISELESNHNPSTVYKENFRNSKGEYVLSTGLLQLSYESAAGYGFKTSTEKLKDPLHNLEVGVAIMNHWVKKDRFIASKYRPYVGGGRYWSTLRGDKLTKIQGWTFNLS